MYKTLILVVSLVLVKLQINAQDTLVKPYQPEADAKMQIAKAVEEAKFTNKHVLVMVGGNWCKWCLLLTKYMNQHESIDSIINADYIYIHVNYSKENKNPEIMRQLEYPQRFGFPVLVILDENGRRLHTQNTVYLEKDESYSEETIKDFLLDWNYQSLHPVEK